jgi:glycerophosphoryl diester phosphodiesterase
VAHRGSSTDRPENTLAAYQRAIEGGATAIEIDLRLTRDGHLVSLHDDRLDRTTNGTGLLAAKTLAEALDLDAGSWFDARYMGERIPTFREILELAKDRCDVFIDLKEEGRAYCDQVIRDGRRFGDPDRIILGVRSVEHARYFHTQSPQARQVGLIPAQGDIEAFVEAGVQLIRLWPRWLPENGLVKRLRATGAELHVSADQGTREEVIAVLVHRPVSLSSDDPARLVRTLEELRSGR